MFSVSCLSCLRCYGCDCPPVLFFYKLHCFDTLNTINPLHFTEPHPTCQLVKCASYHLDILSKGSLIRNKWRWFKVPLFVVCTSLLTEVSLGKPVPWAQWVQMWGVNAQGWLTEKACYSRSTRISGPAFCVFIAGVCTVGVELQLDRRCSDTCEPQRGSQAQVIAVY